MTAMIRPAADLPGDPARLRLTYTHEHLAEPFAYEDTLEGWYVSIRQYHEEGAECEDGCTSACEELAQAGAEVGHLILWRLRDFTGHSRLLAADAESGDLESIAGRVLEGDEYSTAFEAAVDHPVGDLLILDKVFLARHWRGFGLGPVFAAEAIRRLSAGCCAVAAEPGMAESPQDGREVTDDYRLKAQRKIAALWESIGFRPFQDGIQLLDTAVQAPLDLHRQRREDLKRLSAAYRDTATGNLHR